MNRITGLLISALSTGVTILCATTVHAFDGVTLTADYIVDKGTQRRSFLDKQIRLDYRRVFVAGFLGALVPLRRLARLDPATSFRS